MAKLSSIVAVSTEIEARLRALGMPAEKIAYIPNSVDCQRFRPAKPEEKEAARHRFQIPQGARLVIVCVGAVTERKGQHLLIQALSLLSEDVHLLLVGPTRERQYAVAIEHLIAESGLGARVHRSDHIPDVEQAYYSADIFALPSNDEGMPNALVEAMASGLACIGTPVSGIADLLEGNMRGRIVARSQADIISALQGYCGNDDLRCAHGDAAREYVLAHHRSDETADRMHALLRRLAASRERKQY